jgi:peptide deformylase
LKKIKLLDDPILRQVCIEVPHNMDINNIIKEMHEAMVDEKGIGIAANQLGYSYRIFLLKSSQEPGYEVFVNPEIISSKDEVDFEGEGCLSIPGTSSTTRRFNALVLKWKDNDSKINERLFEGIDAFAVQHEMDHLNGKLYIDQFGQTKRQLIVSRHKKFLRRSSRR